MSYGEINWPKNANTGDVYQGPNGRYWIFDGCAWTGTCCPPISECSNVIDGILLTLGVTSFIGEAIGPYLEVNITYFGDDSYGNPVYHTRGYYNGPDMSDYFFTVLFNQDTSSWTLYFSLSTTNDIFEGNEIAYLPSVSPGESIEGNWEFTNPYSNDPFFSVTSACGADNGICVTQFNDGFTYTYNLLPWKSTIDSPIEGYLTPPGVFLFWDSITEEWIFIDYSSSYYSIAGISTQPPSGLYPGTPLGDLTFNSGYCSCDPMSSGIGLNLYDEGLDLAYTIVLYYDGMDVNGNPVFRYDYSVGGTDGYQFKISFNISTSKWELIFSAGSYVGSFFSSLSDSLVCTNDYFYLGNQWGTPSLPEFGTAAWTHCGSFVEPFCITVTTNDDTPEVRTWPVWGIITGGQFGYLIASQDPSGFIFWNGSNWEGTLPYYSASPPITITFSGTPNEYFNPVGSWTNDGGFLSVETSEGPCAFADNPPLPLP